MKFVDSGGYHARTVQSTRTKWSIVNEEQGDMFTGRFQPAVRTFRGVFIFFLNSSDHVLLSTPDNICREPDIVHLLLVFVSIKTYCS